MGRDENYGLTWECDAKCDKETRAAVHVILETGDAYWIPKSVLTDDSEVYEEGNEGVLSVQLWWADANDLT